MASRDEILHIISLVRSRNDFVFIPTEKNRETRLSLGLTVDDMRQLIYSLTSNDYYCGPEPDRDLNRSGDVWIFKKYAYGALFYIKIKIELTGEIKILSCHIDNIVV